MTVINGCAKRESEDVNFTQDLKLEEIETVSKENGSYKECVLGEESFKLNVNAKVIIPNEIQTGTVEIGYPESLKLEEALNIGTLEEVEPDTWGIKSENGAYLYEKCYKQDDDYAMYYDAGLKALFTGEGSVDKATLSKRADEILSEMGYEAILSRMEENGNMLACFYTPSIQGIPIVTNDLGLGGTQLSMVEGGLGEALLEKQVLKSTLHDTQVISLDTALILLEKHCVSGDIPLLSEKDEIRYIRLAYYVNEERNLIPVWCFSIEFPSEEQEYVVYCMNALTGDIEFDYDNYGAMGEGEDE